MGDSQTLAADASINARTSDICGSINTPTLAAYILARPLGADTAVIDVDPIVDLASGATD